MGETDWAQNFRFMRNTAAPITVSFDVTSNCNLRCVHCFNDSGNTAVHHDVSAAQRLEIARQIAQLHVHSVCLCGGEALCCDNLFEIMDILRPNVGSMNMVSNGYSMTAQKARQLVEHGIYLVQISVDGAYAWQHDLFRGVTGSFARATQALRYLKEAGVPQTCVSFVPNKLNFRSLPAYAQLCCELGVYSIRAMPFLPSGRGRSIGRNLMMDAQAYFEFCRSFTRLKAEYAGRLVFEWGDPLDHMRRMKMNAAHGLHTYMMEVKSNGDITGTSYLPVILGNCMRHSLKEYWDAGYKLLWANEGFTHFTEQIHAVYDLDTFEPRPYSGETILMDLMEAAK